MLLWDFLKDVHMWVNKNRNNSLNNTLAIAYVFYPSTWETNREDKLSKSAWLHEILS